MPLISSAASSSSDCSVAATCECSARLRDCAAVRAQADLAATGTGTTRIWRASRPQARDLAVSILLDASRSTESAVTGRAVIDIEREALMALEEDYEFLLKGDVFTKDQIEAYAELKWEEVMRTETTPCPVEFDMYYSA